MLSPLETARITLAAAKDSPVTTSEARAQTVALFCIVAWLESLEGRLTEIEKAARR